MTTYTTPGGNSKAYDRKESLPWYDSSMSHSVPTLKTLHLSGIGLYDSIPPIFPTLSLTDLILSNNQLTEAIPESIQTHLFERLDLESNQLSGVLPTPWHHDRA